MTKGIYGYIKDKRRKVVVMTIAMFLLSVAMYFWGYYLLGTVQSYYTVIAVLGMLPASKSLVNVIMYYKARECDEKIYQKVSQIPCSHSVLYSLYLTMYQHSTTVECVHIYEKHLILLVSNHAVGQAVEEQVKKVLGMHQLKGTSVKVFYEFEPYKNRILQLNKKYDDTITEKERQLTQLMIQITL